VPFDLASWNDLEGKDVNVNVSVPLVLVLRILFRNCASSIRASFCSCYSCRAENQRLSRALGAP